MGCMERKYKQIPEKIVVLLFMRHGRAGRAAAGVADLARILARMEPPRDTTTLEKMPTGVGLEKNVMTASRQQRKVRCVSLAPDAMAHRR
jgi:hypothetical protein